MNNIMKKIHNNKIKEIKNIKESIHNLFKEIGSCCDISKFDFEYTYKYKMINEEYEFDSIFIIKNKNWINIFIFEFKDYSTYDWYILSNDHCENNLRKKRNQIESFKKDILNKSNVNNINFYFIFSYKYDNSFHYKFEKISKNIKGLSFEQFQKIFKNIRNNKNHSHINYLYINKLINRAKDVNSIIEILLNKKNNIIENEHEISNINHKLNEGVNLFMFEGEAGTGKTILACNLFISFLNKQNDAMLFLINKNLLKELKQTIDKENKNVSSKILWHSEDFENYLRKININRKTYIFIDEAQRLNKENVKLIKKLIPNKNIIFFLFGDERQKIYFTDIGYKELIESRNKTNLYSTKLTKYFRIDENTHRSIDFIFFNKKSNKEILYTENINIFNDSKTFFQNYKKNKSTKALTTIQFAEKQNFDQILKINGFSEATKNLNDRYLFLHNKEYLKNKYFYAFDVISREIENIYIFVPDFIKIDEKNNLYVDYPIDNSYKHILLNQLYVLLTRGKNKINVFINNKEYYDFVMSNKSLLKK